MFTYVCLRFCEPACGYDLTSTDLQERAQRRRGDALWLWKNPGQIRKIRLIHYCRLQCEDLLQKLMAWIRLFTNDCLVYVHLVYSVNMLLLSDHGALMVLQESDSANPAWQIWHMPSSSHAGIHSITYTLKRFISWESELRHWNWNQIKSQPFVHN